MERLSRPFEFDLAVSQPRSASGISSMKAAAARQRDADEGRSAPNRSVRNGWSVSRETSGRKSTHRFEPTSDAFHDEYDHGSWCIHVPEPPAGERPTPTGRSRSSAAARIEDVAGG